MYQEKITLTPKDILEKQFPIGTRGYNMEDVDKFLDTVMNDYVEYNKVIRRLINENDEAGVKIEELKKEIRNLRAGMDALKTSEKEITNIDLIRRISHLEKIVYGKND